MYLVEGYQTLITFSSNPAVFLRAREIQPPEFDGGGEIDTTVMANVAFRTKSEKTLKHMNAITVQAQYDPFVYFQLISMINVRQIITIRFPDLATLVVYGWIDKFTPTSLKEGEFPLAEVKALITHRSPAGIETGMIAIGGGTAPGVVVR